MNWICDNCNKLLIEFNRFRNMCFDTDIYLRDNSKINQKVTIDGVQEKKSESGDISVSQNGGGRKKRDTRIRTHLSTSSPSDPKPYNCPDCDQKFSESRQVYGHIRHVHKEAKDIPPRRYKKEVEVRKFNNSSEVKPRVQPSIQPKRNNQKCRICLNEIFRTVSSLNDEKLNSLFISCTGIDVRKCLDISPWICSYCERKLFQFYNFQEKCWESDIFLRLNDTSLLQ